MYDNSVYYIRKFYLSSRYHPHYALMPCWPVLFSFVCAAFITATSEVCVGCLSHITDTTCLCWR